MKTVVPTPVKTVVETPVKTAEKTPISTPIRTLHVQSFSRQNKMNKKLIAALFIAHH